MSTATLTTLFKVHPPITPPGGENHAPVLAAIGNRAMSVDGTLQFTAEATDEDVGDTLTFSLDGGMETTGATIDPVSGLFEWDATGFATGDYSVTIRVIDNGSPNLDDSETIVVSVVDALTITSPTGDAGEPEGEFIEIPFTVVDPTNSVVTYTLEYLVGGNPTAYPSGMTLTTKANGEKCMRWWPTLAQSGTYSLRFTAVNESLSSDTITITLTVSNRTTNPTILSITTSGYMPPAGTIIHPGDIGIVNETTYFDVSVVGADPESDNISMTQAGLPGSTTITESPANTFAVRYIPDSTIGAHNSVGDYATTFTMSDGTNTFDFPFVVRVMMTFRHDDEIIYIEPRCSAGNGLVRAVTRGGAGNWVAQIVSGTTVRFDPYVSNFWQANYLPTPRIPSDMYWRLVLHTPDGSGNDVKTYISSLQSGIVNITWDSTSIADGTYKVGYEFFSGSADPDVDAARYTSWPNTIIVNNTAGAVTGAQWLPIDTWEDEGYRNRWRGPMEAVQWAYYDGDCTTKHTVHPFPYSVVTPPANSTERNALIPTSAWVYDTLFGPLLNRYTLTPMFSKTTEGHPHIGFATNEGFDESYEGGVIRFFERDGGRLNCYITAYTQFRPVPGSDPSLIGIGPEGRLLKVDPSQTGDNLCVTIAGHKVDSANTLPLFDDGGNYVSDQKVAVGTVADFPFNLPKDLAFDPDDANQVFIADYRNHRICKANLTTGAVVTYAGDMTYLDGFGKPNHDYLDGARLSARFYNPASVEVIGRNLYIADKGNCALRAIDLDTGVVSTPLGRGSGAPTVPADTVVFANYATWTFASVSFDDSPVAYPFWIRKTSDDKLIIQEYGNEGRGTSNLRIVDFGAELVTQLYRTVGEVFECDYLGNVGPIDDILYRSGTNSTGYRLSIAGTLRGSFVTEGSPAFYEAGGNTFTETGSTYPTSMCIDDQQGKLYFPSVYRPCLTMMRPRTGGDPSATHNNTLHDRGRIINALGTVKDFGHHPSRPSFAALHGRFGLNWLGATPTFDDLTSMSNADLADYIAAGMESPVARPEITAIDMQALIYYIRMNSIEGKTTTVNATTIASDLATAGYWPVDSQQPQIRNVNVSTAVANQVTITWNTDENCNCVLFFSRNDYFGFWQSSNDGIETSIKSPITALSKSHSVTLLNLVSGATYYYKIKARDRSANVSVRTVATFVVT